MDNLQQARKHADLIYDVGMHKGEDTAYYLNKGFRVVGLEADPDLAGYCRSEFKKQISEGSLVLLEGAITDANHGLGGETVRFYKNNTNTVWGTVVADWARRNEMLGASSEVIDVKVLDFSECLRNYGIPYYIKIDIEGMDMVCLRALEHFDQKPDYVSLESEKVVFGRLRAELDLLSRLGYTRFLAVQQRGISAQKEPHPALEGVWVGQKFQNGSSGLFGRDLPYKWKSYSDVLWEYRKIFIRYKLFGDYGLFRSMRGWSPGWYDTHAKHSSAS